jgi:hypothetical protein
MEYITTIIIAASIPSSITAFFFWRLQRRLIKSEDRREKKEKARDELFFLIMEGSNANMTLGVANAEAISGKRCNGNVDDALEEAERVQKKQTAFINKQGIENIWGRVS